MLAVAVSVVGQLSTTPAAHAVSPGIHISCDLNITLDFTPAITPTLQIVAADAKGWLGDKSVTAAGTAGACASPDGTAAGITGSTGGVYPTGVNGGSGSATGPQNCTQSNFPNGTGKIIWNDGSEIRFDWQFGFTAGGFTFAGQVTYSTAAWSAPGDQFFVELTKFTQNGGTGAGAVPIVSCFLPGGVVSTEFTGVFQLFTPAGGTPAITVTPGPCTVAGGATPGIQWTDAVKGTGFPASSVVNLRDTAFVFGTNPTTGLVTSATLKSVSTTVTTDAAGNFTVNITVNIPYPAPEPSGTIEQNSDSVLAFSGAAVAANKGGPNFCVA